MTPGRGRSRAVEGGPHALRALALLVQLSIVASYNGLHAQCPDGSTPPCRVQPAGAAPAPSSNSVAVLYLENLSHDTTDAYLADGLTEEITDRLGAIERLQVKSRSLVRRAQGPAPGDLMTLSRTLRVRYVVEGSVRRSGARVRVSVRLVRAADGFRVWGASFDRGAMDLLAIEADIAREVATAIGGRLLPAEQATLALRPTGHPEAYDHFMRGNYYLERRTPDAGRRAIEEYDAAVRLDPVFVKALARVAHVHAIFLIRGWQYPGLGPESLLARGLALADRALRQDSGAADAWLARGALLWSVDPTLQSPKEALGRATRLDPANAEAWLTYGATLTHLGDTTAASRSLRQALAIDPALSIAMIVLADGAFIERRYEEARRWADSALAVDPGFHDGYAMRAVFRLYRGDTAGARGDAQSAIRVAAGEQNWEERVLAQLAAREGDTVRARGLIERLLADAPNAPTVNPFYARHLAAALVALGDQQRALEVLESVRPRGAHLWFFLRSPEFDAIRSHPRFERLLDESRPR